QLREEVTRNRSCQGWRDRVPDLFRDLDLRSFEFEVVGKRLQSRGFAMGNRPMGSWVQVPTLFRLEELRTNRERRAIPPKTSHDVGGSGGLLRPASRRQIRPIPL